jgi:hypothetical protein
MESRPYNDLATYEGDWTMGGHVLPKADFNLAKAYAEPE